MALAQVAAATNVSANGYTTTIDTASRTLGSGSQRGLVAVVMGTSTNSSIDSVKFDPGGGNERTFTALGQSGGPLGDPRVRIFYLVNPPAGASGIFRVALSGPNAFQGGICVTEWTGMDQSTPMDGFTGTGVINSPGPSINVTSRVGDIVVDGIYATDDVGAAGGGQSEQLNVTLTAPADGLASSTKAGAASVSMSWTINAYLVLVGASIRATVADNAVPPLLMQLKRLRG